MSDIAIDAPSHVEIHDAGRLICLLCSSVNVHVEFKVATADLARGFERMLARPIIDEFHPHSELSYCHCESCDLRFYFPPITGSERFYLLLQGFGWYYVEDRPEYAMAARWIAADDDILELGCGAGNFAKYVSPGRYTGIEFSPDAVRTAIARGHRVFAATAAQHAHTHPGCYRVVCSFQVLEHISNVRETIADCLCLLKPGGYFIVCVPSADSYVRLVENGFLNMPPHHVTHWSDEALRNIGVVFGLELLDIEHELLADFHKKAFLELIMRRAANRVLRRPEKRLDFSLVLRVTNKIISQASKFLVKGLDDPLLLPRGQSVLAVYRKPIENDTRSSGA